MRYAILGRNLVVTNWTGAPTTLGQYDSVAMPQTPNGSLVLGYWNKATQNNDGTLAMTSGGRDPISLDVPALLRRPSIDVGNWQADNLTLTNVSANASTPIAVEAFGPGIPGVAPMLWTVGTPLTLSTLKTAAGQAPPNAAQFILRSSTANLTIVALIGGPQDASKNNAYVFAVNFPSGVDSTGYAKVATGNSLTYQFNWPGASVFAANMSSAAAAPAVVNLIAL